MLANRRPALRRRKDAKLRANEPRDDTLHEVGKPTPSVEKPIVATPTPKRKLNQQNIATPCATIDKPTPSVGTPIAAEPPKDAIFSEDELWDAIGHVGKPTPSAETLFVTTLITNSK
jgi:hypothetical protein